MNNWSGDLIIQLIDLRLQELRAEAERRRLIDQSRRQHETPQRSRRMIGGLFLAALTKSVPGAPRPRGWAWLHHDGA